MIFEKFREGCARGGQRSDEDAQVILQLHLSWAETDEAAMQNALVEWPNGGMKFPKQDIRSPHDFEQMAKHRAARRLRRPDADVGSDLEVHRREIQNFLDMGFDQIYLHNVGRNQAEWIEAFGREVLPALHA